MSSVAALIQQQQTRVPTKPVTTGNAWHWWDAQEIATVTQAPLLSVQNNWPLLYDAMIRYDVLSRDVARGILGTVAVETAHTFEPVREAFWLDENWRAANLRYYPYYGRGFVQLTWQSNYEAFGNRIGVDVVDSPDMVMEPKIAALAMLDYFVNHNVIAAANEQNWPEVRRLVQGAYAGLDTLEQVVNDLA